MDMERYGRVHIDNGLQPNPFMESHTDVDEDVIQARNRTEGTWLHWAAGESDLTAA